MTEQEALQWCQDNNAYINYFNIDDGQGGTTPRVTVAAGSFVASNGATLVEAVEKNVKYKSIRDRKEAIRQKRASRGLIQ